jgi:hypothetical protein
MAYSTRVAQSSLGDNSLDENPPRDPRNGNTDGLTPTSTYTGPRTVEALLGHCIDHVLSEVLGTKARESIYDYMARNYGVAREDIPTNMSKFFALTGEAFGSGSRTIAHCIVRQMWQELGWTFTDTPGLEFWDYLEIARARMARETVGIAKVSLTTSERLSSQ